MGFIAIICLGIWLLCWSAAAYNYWSAFAEVRPRLAPQFQNSRTVRLVLDTFIWDPASASKRARRQYLISHIFASIGAIPLAALAWIWEPVRVAVIVAAMGVLGVTITFNRWRKYRSLL
jgi:hypothetical protein